MKERNFQMMKRRLSIAIKILFTILISIMIIIGIYNILIKPLTKINPNYIILEDGRRGYVMNTENILYSSMISLIIVILLLIIFRKKIYKWVKIL